MQLARRVVEPEELAGEDRDDVLLVVHVRDLHRQPVDEVRPRLVAHARQAVPDEARRHAGQVQVQEDRVDKRDRRAYIYRFQYIPTIPSVSAREAAHVPRGRRGLVWCLPREWPVTVTFVAPCCEMPVLTAASTSEADLHNSTRTVHGQRPR